MKRTCLIHGSYHIPNFGDLLLADLMSKHVSENSKFKPQVLWKHRQNTSFPKHATETMKHLLNASACVFGGGGYLNDRNQERQATRRLLRYSIPAYVLHKRKIPYVIVGTGAGPWLAGKGAKRVQQLCRHAKSIAVRDEASKDVLKKAGVNADNIQVTADLVIALSKEQIPQPAISEAQHALAYLPKRSLRVGIHFESLRPNDLKQALTAIKLSTSAHKDILPVWIVDSNGSDELRQLVRDISQDISLEMPSVPKLSTWGTAALIGEMDAIFTSKLHVGITAWALNVPTFGISSHPKTKRFYAQTLRSQFQVDYDGNAGTFDVIHDWIDHLSSNEDSNLTPPGVEKRLRKLACQNYKIVNDLLLTQA